MNKNSLGIFIIVAVLIVGGLLISSAKSVSNKKSTSTEMYSNSDTPVQSSNSVNNLNVGDKKMPEATGPAMQIDKTKSYTAVLNTTKGVIKIELNASQTPITVNNFVSLSKNGFYANTIFHRVINGFMIQGGDPKGNGTGGPGYSFDDEPFAGEYTRGTIAMANAGPNTNGSQFFIMHKDVDLPQNYVIFGKVTEGMDVVDAIATAPTTRSAMGENSKPVDPVKITGVEIIEK